MPRTRQRDYSVQSTITIERHEHVEEQGLNPDTAAGVKYPEPDLLFEELFGPATLAQEVEMRSTGKVTVAVDPDLASALLWSKHKPLFDWGSIRPNSPS